METNHQPIIYTIGHSTHSLEEFLEMLNSFEIKVLVDIRRFPGSRKYPWFNKDNLEKVLKENQINYMHIEDLGGRRKPNPNSLNTVWKNESFRGYADYMETTAFTKAVTELEKIAKAETTAFMCSEAVWWRCHRSMVSDYLKAKGWKVMHIMGIGKEEEHPYTSPAKVVGDCVFYSDKNSV
ncbi:DUF488 family protein [Empedobacter brevis]|uniref:DUF488 domain-containing protein n=1 Tax=Empedobacter brevis TaxID=247 RepID=UPI0039AF524D